MLISFRALPVALDIWCRESPLTFKIPEAIRLTMIKAAPIKIINVKRAFSLIPNIFRPATAQIMVKTRTIEVKGARGKKEVALFTALTAEIQAVRM